MRELVGIAADALMEVAEQEGALMIVVGARPGGFRGALRNALTGSVALRLAMGLLGPYGFTTHFAGDPPLTARSPWMRSRMGGSARTRGAAFD